MVRNSNERRRPATARSSERHGPPLAALLVSAVLGLTPWSAARAEQSEASPIEEAARHHQQGVDLFGRGEYEAAIEAFEHAQELSPSRANIWNITRCHEQLQQYEEALERLEQYLAEEALPQERRAAAMAYQAELNALRDTARPQETETAVPVEQAEDQPAEPEPAEPEEVEPEEVEAPPVASAAAEEPPPPPPPPPPRRSLVAPWATLGSGLALMVTAAVLDIVAFSSASRDPSEAFASVREYRDWQEGYENTALAGDILMGLGAAAAVGGLVWLLLWRRDAEDRARRRPALAVTPSLGALSLNLEY